MRPNQTFSLHPEARVLDPGVPGVEDLLDCLKVGATVHASQRSLGSIAKGGRDKQWLECETSGSTGQPKTIRRTPASWIASFNLAEDLFGITKVDHYAVFGSLGNSLSLFATLEALHIGATLSVLSGTSPKTQLYALLSRSISVIYATPTQLRQLLSSARNEGIDTITTVRRVLVGGGKLVEEERARIALLFPTADVIEFYGTSETSFVTFAGAGTPAGSVGLPYPDVDLMISGTTAPLVSGEIKVNSPYLAEAYLGPQTKLLVQPDGYVLTGEVGYRDASGFLFINGRRDRMITIADVNVYPEAIEQVLTSASEVEACAVVAIADRARGSRLVCFIQSSSDKIHETAIRRKCRELLGDSHVPKEILRILAIPTLPSGKPNYTALHELAVALI